MSFERTTRISARPFTGYSKSTPNRLSTCAKTKKHASVIAIQEANVHQKPMRSWRKGNAKNIGNVGTTYQNVYQAWLDIFSGG
jgi:hypothetical protein